MPLAIPGLTVRPAVADDLDEILAIEARSFTDPWSRRSFTSVLGAPPVLFCVAVSRGRIVGYLVAWFVGGEGEIGNIAVDESARGQGIGTLLLDVALEEGRRRGTDAVYLEVRETNAAARRMYERRGFEAVGRRRRYYRRPEEDALILRRVLESP